MNLTHLARRRGPALAAWLVFLGFLIVGALPTSAAEKPVNTTRQGVAIKGYDPVAYFTDGVPTKGAAEFAHTWNGATWWFVSAAHRDLFAAAPEKYAPQYGGYCAWAVSKGYTAPVDPTAWKIVEGRLFLNYDASVKKMWEADQTNRIKLADENWPKALE